MSLCMYVLVGCGSTHTRQYTHPTRTCGYGSGRVDVSKKCNLFCFIIKVARHGHRYVATHPCYMDGVRHHNLPTNVTSVARQRPL